MTELEVGGIKYRYHQDSAVAATVVAYDGQQLVASLNMYDIDCDPFIDGLQVIAAYRRRGVARSMWHLAREYHPNLRHSSECTPVGHAWAKAVGGFMPPVSIVDPARYRYEEVLVSA